MAFIIADRVKETSTTTGTGALTLAGAMTGFQTFASKCAVGDTCFYALQGVDAGGAPSGEWECGMGTYSAANTLTRTTVTSSSNAGAAVVLSAGTKQVYISMPAVQVAWARERLTANRTYYVSATGSDSNNGLTAGTPFLTIQKAVEVASLLDASIYQVTIQAADGTYTGAVLLYAMLGSLPLVIQGNSVTPANVHINVTGNAFASQYIANSYTTIKDMKISASSACISCYGGGVIKYGNIQFGVGGTRHLDARQGGLIECISSYSIVGASPMHYYAARGGMLRCAGMTVAITGTPAFSTAFAVTEELGSVVVNSNTFSGAATGLRYSVSGNGTIFTASGGATYLPGDTAGSAATGGQYL